MSKKITYTRDILQEVAIEQGKDLRVIEKVYKNQMNYLKHLVQEGDKMSIFIPSIGTLYQTIAGLKSDMKRRPDNVNLKKRKEDLDSLTKGIRETVGYTFIRHYQKELHLKKYFSDGKKWEEIERLQNEE